MRDEATGETLCLKWGTLKGWRGASEKTMGLLRQYHEHPVSFGCMTQRDTKEQVEILCDIIDSVNGVIYNDWSGEEMTKEGAKKYVREYRR